MKHALSALKMTLVGTLLSGCIVVHAGSINYRETQVLNLSTDGIETLRVAAGAGFIKMVGKEGLQEIRVTAELAVDKQHYQLSLSKQGSNAVLVADPNTTNIGWGSDSPMIDLTIEVPAYLNAIVDDGSGAIEINHINGDLEINDGSGEISVVGVGGLLDIDDGSGDIIVENIHGALKVEDGSGDIQVSKVGQTVTIDDGSGSIDINTVGGAVTVQDSSGDMKLVNIVGHVTIDDGSGSIDLLDLENGLTIVNAGSGGLSIKNVKGDVNYND